MQDNLQEIYDHLTKQLGEYKEISSRSPEGSGERMFWEGNINAISNTLIFIERLYQQ